jgi:hypothetical protein
MSIIDDFADIAKRMKGELAPKPKVEEPALDEPMGLPAANWRLYGIDPGQPAPTTSNPAGNVPCPPAPPWPMGQAPMPPARTLAQVCRHCLGTKIRHSVLLGKNVDCHECDDD